MSQHNSSHLTPSNGITGGYRGNNQTIFQAMMAFTAIAWYNAIELLVLIFFVFKKYSGLYFWSMLVTAIVIIPYALGAWMKQVQLAHIHFLAVSFSTWPWMAMVTGNSLVLYSRLHLVTQSKAQLRFVLSLIVVDSILLYIPTAVLTYGSQSAEKWDFLPGYEVMEKIQMTIITVQEFIISGIYLWEVRKILRVVYEGSTRKLMWELASINIVIIILDIALLTVEFLNFYQIETTMKGMVYSIKLKLEFGVLSKLVKIVTNKQIPGRFASNTDTHPELGLGAGYTYTNDDAASSIGFASASQGTGPKAGVGVEKHSSGGSDSKESNLNHTNAEHLDFATIPQNIMETEKDTSAGAELDFTTMTSAEAAEPPIPPRRRLSRRSSIEQMYPGKLD